MSSQGSRNRLQRLEPGTESYYSSLIEVPEHTPARDDRRSRRQSRVSREIVSQGTYETMSMLRQLAELASDPTASATPTREWQEQLARRLAQGGQRTYAPTPMSSVSPTSASSGSYEYARTRRRLNWPQSVPNQQNWENLYTLSDSNRMDTNDPGYRSYSTTNSEHSLDPNTMDETAEAFGHLSVDQNKEVRGLDDLILALLTGMVVPLPWTCFRVATACAKP